MGAPIEVKAGTYTGTGAALSVTLGFRPTYLKVFNQTDGDTTVEFIDGMTAATGIVTTTAVAAVASQGITLASTGFGLGTDAGANETGKVYLYIAFGGN
jgi:hypothetical protein